MTNVGFAKVPCCQQDYHNGWVRQRANQSFFLNVETIKSLFFAYNVHTEIGLKMEETESLTHKKLS